MGTYIEKKHNGHLDLEHFKPSTDDVNPGVVEVEPEPEEGKSMPPRKEDFTSTAGKQILVTVLISLMVAGATRWIDTVKGEAKVEYHERRLTELTNEMVLYRTRAEILEREMAVVKAKNSFVDEVKLFKDEVIKEIKRR